MATAKDDDSGATDGSDSEGPSIRFHPHAVTIAERPEGYREIRCIPAWWSYSGERPLELLLAECYCVRKGEDPHGVRGDPDFWSASDAAMRLRTLPPEDLALRELGVLATRRWIGYNAPRPWLSASETRHLSSSWERDAGDVHWTDRIPENEGVRDLWHRYGMGGATPVAASISYAMLDGHTPLRDATPWKTAGGTWYSWAAIARWDRWPRRQEAAAQPAGAEDCLRLFVSHRWEALDHPDPTGAQLQALNVGLTLSVAAALLRKDAADALWRTHSGLPELIARFLDAHTGDHPRAIMRAADVPALKKWAERIHAAASDTTTESDFLPLARAATESAPPALAALGQRILVWYDYASMFQSPRTPDEERLFREELLQLNAIQRDAATVVIAGDQQYLSRAWCFLELCGGLRQAVVELTPSWGKTVGAGTAPPFWWSRSDQLIAALNFFGTQAIERSGLGVTHTRDFPDIARLLAQLPLAGLIESDDTDLVGGSIPVAMRDGQWVIATETAAVPAPVLDRAGVPLLDWGRVPRGGSLHAATDAAGAEGLRGPVGMWIYTTQRALSLAWAARAGEIWACLADSLRSDLRKLRISVKSQASVACTWADSRALGDDGSGWTRVVPSDLKLLVIVTQDAIPSLCRLYDLVLYSHLCAGVPVVTYMPATGRSVLLRGAYAVEQGVVPTLMQADVLAVPRFRRSSSHPRYFFVPKGMPQEDAEVLAALRLDPTQGPIRPEPTSDSSLPELTPPAGMSELLAQSEARVRTEALARSLTASWDTWATPRLHQSAWACGMAPLQLSLIDRIVRRASTVSSNPLERRKLIYILVEKEAGYALPPTIVEDLDILLKMIADERARADVDPA